MKHSIGPFRGCPAHPSLWNFRKSPRARVTSSVVLTVVPAPVIQSFTASPASIQQGQAAKLTWQASNATSFSLDQGIGAVPGTSAWVWPGSSTTFTLTATNKINGVSVSRTATATVTVGAAAGVAWKRDIIYLGSEAVAEINGTGGSGVHELHNDHLGSPRIITNGATGQIEGRQVYGPFGEWIRSEGSYTPVTGYTGHMQQDAMGLIYMRGRYYSPAWHRFVNSDQGVDPNSWNQMAYVGGSPFHATDPSGMTMLNDTDCVNGRGNVSGYPCTGGSTGGGPISYGSGQPGATVPVFGNTPTALLALDDFYYRVVAHYEELLPFGISATPGTAKQQTPPDKSLDCAKLKALGIGKTSLARMKATMASANYGANPLEAGYSYWSGGYADGQPSIDPNTGQPTIALDRPGPRYETPGHTFHVHPNGWDPMPSPQDQRNYAIKWYGGQHFVGSSGMLVNYNKKNPSGVVIGTGNWWEVDCK